MIGVTGPDLNNVFLRRTGRPGYCSPVVGLEKLERAQKRADN